MNAGTVRKAPWWKTGWAWQKTAAEQKKLGISLMAIAVFLALVQMIPSRTHHEPIIFQAAALIFAISGIYYVLRGRRLSAK